MISFGIASSPSTGSKVLRPNDEILDGLAQCDLDDYTSAPLSYYHAGPAMVSLVWHALVEAGVNYDVHTLAHLVLPKNGAQRADSTLAYPL